MNVDDHSGILFFFSAVGFFSTDVQSVILKEPLAELLFAVLRGSIARAHQAN